MKDQAEKMSFASNNIESFQMMESPSVNVFGNARTLGKLAAYMANGGTLDGKCMFSEDGWN